MPCNVCNTVVHEENRQAGRQAGKAGRVSRQAGPGGVADWDGLRAGTGGGPGPVAGRVAGRVSWQAGWLAQELHES